MPKRWTPVEEAALFQESSKMSIDQLANKYGVTPKSVAVKLQKLRQAMRKTGVTDILSIPRQRASVGGEAKRWTPEEENELLDLHRKGFKTDKIAAHFNVSQKAISVKLLKVKKKVAAQEIISPIPEPVVVKLQSPVIKEPMKPMSIKPPVMSDQPPKPAAIKPAPPPAPRPPQRPVPYTSQSGSYGTSPKQQEGEANTQFKIWNGTEWITIKVPKKIIHV